MTISGNASNTPIHTLSPAHIDAFLNNPAVEHAIVEPLVRVLVQNFMHRESPLLDQLQVLMSIGRWCEQFGLVKEIDSSGTGMGYGQGYVHGRNLFIFRFRCTHIYLI